jgi:hypothetical protein
MILPHTKDSCEKMSLICRCGEEFENARSQYLKHVEAEVHEHIPLSWETPLPLPFKHSPGLFSLVPYMLRNSINDFKKQRAIYWALFEGGWGEWVDTVNSL